ncbi:hypothetical protein VNI00_009623 [Paramarasmius palmivorus]|uniref:Uncharacterized protein n=1 Tax=Paramarasmius palmivorus TaxID=297713 RepID=A0AAW0CLH9_9AGAR
MFSYLRLLAIAIFIIAVSMSNQRVDALALPAPALIPRRNHDSSSPTPGVAAFAGPGGNAEGGSVSQSNEGSTLPINVLSNNAGNGGDASSKSGIIHDTPYKSARSAIAASLVNKSNILHTLRAQTTSMALAARPMANRRTEALNTTIVYDRLCLVSTLSLLAAETELVCFDSDEWNDLYTNHKELYNTIVLLFTTHL